MSSPQPLRIPPVIPPTELAELCVSDPTIRLLDVRTPGEFAAQHIAGAYNVPLDTLAEHAAEIRASVADPVVLVCRSGQRARKAEDALKSAGMMNLHVLDGGVAGWVAAGNPVVEGAPRMSLERQVRIAAGSLAAIGGFLAVFVHPLFALISGVVGSGLVFAGITDTCAMGMLLARLPYNRPASCDVGAMVRALSSAPLRPPARGRIARDDSCTVC
jgi:rhodanese-related sulfurtransferase